MLLLLIKRAVNLKTIISHWGILRACQLITSRRLSHELLLIRSFKFWLYFLLFALFRFLSLSLSLSRARALLVDLGCLKFTIAKSIFSQEQQNFMPDKVKSKIARDCFRISKVLKCQKIFYTRKLNMIRSFSSS